MANPPQFAILNHAAVDSGIPRESATQRIGIRCHAFIQKIGITLAGLGKFDDSFGELIAPALPGAFSPGANFLVIDR